MALTDREIKAFKAGRALVKLSDGGGLQLWVSPDGAKRWRLAYRVNGAQKVLALGVYPSTSLREARDGREAAKKLLAAGQDPSVVRKLAKAALSASDANTFDSVAAELLERKRREGKAQRTIVKFEWFMRLARPSIGARPIVAITAAEILSILRPIEARGRVETAKKLRGAIGQVFRFAIATGRAENDPTSALKGAIASPTVNHRAAIIEPKAFGGLLRAIATYEGAPETRAALELAALTFVRPGELRAAEWAEFDVLRAVWSIPAEKMKMKRPHRVPLASRAVAILQDLHRITGQGKLLFPSVRSPTRCMSENTINAALRRMGFTKDEMTGHGFRAVASSLLNECSKWNADAIEAQLAHVDNDSVRRPYNRADYWSERVAMMAYWADYLDKLRNGENVIAILSS